ncbi:MAG: helix-turn-helix transcriptional regulator [Acidobacteria bacterium]|nr:helix-turn-helix transcriptional regulator [Acidobacteriota bacterium]
MSVQVKLSRLSNDDRLLHIYRAAARVIHQKGYDATSLNDIAEAAGTYQRGLVSLHQREAEPALQDNELCIGFARCGGSQAR